MSLDGAESGRCAFIGRPVCLFGRYIGQSALASQFLSFESTGQLLKNFA